MHTRIIYEYEANFPGYFTVHKRIVYEYKTHYQGYLKMHMRIVYKYEVYPPNEHNILAHWLVLPLKTLTYSRI